MAMDLNELLHEHQAAVMRAAAAGDATERDNHFAKVAEYAERVRALRKVKPMTDTPTKAGGPPAIIYGTYAGEAPQASGTQPIASWEDEGGAVRHPHTPLPEGIASQLLREYRVGPYVYQDLDLAVAEHLRQLAAADRSTA
ncbi:MAG: hypothetical protein KJO02_07280 [Erythrobacter sp.]|nr:hypothetical protein [Erythrobacter sp.]NNC52943.1 hypothetical protein [Erythrobacter sp.]